MAGAKGVPGALPSTTQKRKSSETRKSGFPTTQRTDDRREVRVETRPKIQARRTHRGETDQSRSREASGRRNTRQHRAGKPPGDSLTATSLEGCG
ncbi:hypothetical protein NDU88_003220 [Pleurodeles waltl]|uniref:Uncharacterized protein n=1 Tax=Pleurodeles waltl TaxID=8319 RepID=A0AAV7NG76_PLEWA|nr:hypothetical protein NDU88_003220 [Pleurodeles waltl]